MASADISQTVADMRRYYNSGETKSVSFRIKQLRKLKSMILSPEDEIIHALYNDLKKPPFESYASEIGIMIGIRRSSLALHFLLDASHHIAYCETPILMKLIYYKRSAVIWNLNYPAKAGQSVLRKHD